MSGKMVLAGIKVLDLSRVLAGPYCTMVLADLGAEVVKVEIPGAGDDSRAFGPFVGTESAYFMSLNRNKQSITLNLKEQAAKDVFLDLVKEFDVIVENYRPGTMDKLGLGYDRLAEVNPRLIYAAISGFGHSGPYQYKPAYDVVVQGMGGIMSITGTQDGGPTRIGASIGDITAALFGTIGILAAINHRNETGQGQMVDVAMLDSQVAILENAIARFETSGQVPERIGNRHPSITPFTAVPAADGYLIIAIGNDNLWTKFCRLVEREDLAQSPLFLTNGDRTANWTTLEPMLAEIFISESVDSWISKLEGAGIPCGPINTIDKVLADPQVQARNMIEEVVHPVAGKLKMAGCPIKLSATPVGSIRNPAPLLGQHTEEVLAKYLGLTSEQVEALKKEGAL